MQRWSQQTQLLRPGLQTEDHLLQTAVKPCSVRTPPRRTSQASPSGGSSPVCKPPAEGGIAFSAVQERGSDGGLQGRG